MRQQRLPRPRSAHSAEHIVHLRRIGISRAVFVERVFDALQQLLGVREGIFTGESAVDGKVRGIDQSGRGSFFHGRVHQLGDQLSGSPLPKSVQRAASGTKAGERCEQSNGHLAFNALVRRMPTLHRLVNKLVKLFTLSYS